MVNLTYECFEYLLCVIEVIIGHVFLIGGHEKRFNNRLGQVLLILGTGILLWAKPLIITSALVGMIYSFVLIGIYFVVQFRVRWNELLLYMTVYILCCCLCDIVTTIGYCGLHPEITMEQIMGFHGLRYNNALISKSINFIMILLASKYLMKLDETSFPKTNLYVLSIAFMLSVVCFCTLDSIFRRSLEVMEEDRMDLLFCLLSICVFSVNVIVYWAIQELNKSVDREKEYALIQYQNELMVKAAEENKELNNEWRRIRHDFNNHISCIDMLLQMGNIEKARAYIQKLTQNGQHKELSVNVGNEIAGAVINQKMVRAKSYQIHMALKGDLPAGCIMEDNDLCALLSNALDNAIEAACQIEEVDKRQIELSMAHNARDVLIKISNTVNQDIDVKSTLKTTKKDKKMHGIGMRSMQAIIRKYGGSLSWKCEQQWFVLTMMIPIK